MGFAQPMGILSGKIVRLILTNGDSSVNNGVSENWGQEWLVAIKTSVEWQSPRGTLGFSPYLWKHGKLLGEPASPWLQDGRFGRHWTNRAVLTCTFFQFGVKKEPWLCQAHGLMRRSCWKKPIRCHCNLRGGPRESFQVSNFKRHTNFWRLNHLDRNLQVEMDGR